MKTSADIVLYSTLTILNTNHTHEVLATTPKALKIAINDGRWGGDGAKHLWVPRSVVTVIRHFDVSPDREVPHFDVELPLWFVNENKKKLV